MKDEKKVNKAEEVKEEEKGVELADEDLAEVTGGMDMPSDTRKHILL